MSRAAALILTLCLAGQARSHPLSVAGEAAQSRARAWSKGFKGETSRYRRKRDADIRRIRLELEPDLDKGSIRGELSLAGAALAAGLSRLELDSVRLRIESVRDARGRDLDFEVLPEKLAVRFPKKLPAGEPFELSIRYSGEPKMGLYFFHPDPRYPGQPLELWSQGEPEEARHWMPLYDYPNCRAAFELSVAVPRGLSVVSNGELVERRPGKAPGTELWRWRQDRPFSPYLITLAVGRFTESGARAGGTPLKYFVPQERAADAERTFRRTPEMVKFFEEELGEPYPWGAYSQVALYSFPGGMENAGATSLTDRCLLDEKARVDGDWVEDLLSHELAHQWFGDLLTCKDWSQLWLNEGFASYFQALYRDRWLGGPEFLYDMDRKARDYFTEAAGYQRPIVTNTYAYPNAMFDSHTYDKGAWVLHMLRQELGEEPFWAALRLYLQRGRGGLVDTEDLRRAVEDTTGRPLQEFFDQWLYGAGHPVLDAKFEWDAAAKTARLKIAQKQPKPFQLKLEIGFQGLLKDRSETVLVSKAEETFEWKLSSRPRSVRIDPDGRVLKEIALELPSDMLLRQLESDPSARVRLDAARALKKLGGPEALEALAGCLAKDPFWGLRAECARQLAELGGPSARDALIAALKQDNPKVRQAAAGALKSFVLDEAAYDALAAAEKDESWNVRSSVLSSLGALRLEKARPLLESRLGEDSWNEKVRRGALLGLAALRSEPSLPLLEAWAGPGRAVQARTAALSAYAQVSSERDGRRAADVLSRVLDTEEEAGVLSAAASALAQLGQPGGSGALARLAARDGREELRRRAEDAGDDLREGRKGRLEDLSKELDDLRKDVERLRHELEERRK